MRALLPEALRSGATRTHLLRRVKDAEMTAVPARVALHRPRRLTVATSDGALLITQAVEAVRRDAIVLFAGLAFHGTNVRSRTLGSRQLALIRKKVLRRG